MPRKKSPTNEKFQRFEDGSVRLPTKVLDAETKKVRAPIAGGKRTYKPDPRPVKKAKGKR